MSERIGADHKPSQEPPVPIGPGLAALLDVLPDAAVVVSPHGLIIYANAAVTSLLGYQPEEVRGQPVEMLVPEALRQAHTDTRSGYQRHPVARRMGTGLNLRARRRDGADVPVDIALSPLPHGSDGAILALMRDVNGYVRAKAEAQSEAAQRLLLTELARAIAEPGAAGEAYEEFAARFAAIVPHDRLVIGVLLDGGRLVRYLHVSGLPVAGWEGGKTYDVRHLYLADILTGRKPRFGKAVSPDLQSRYPARNALVAAGLRSTLLVPLIMRDTPVGFLFLASREENAYAEKEAALAEDACRFLAVAIENQRLQDLNGDRARRAEAVAEIGRIIGGAAQVETAFPECAERVRALVPMDRMTVAIADRAHGTYTDVYWNGVNVESWEPRVPRPLKGTNTALILEGGEPLVFNAASAEELGMLYPQFAASVSSGLASAISVPLRHGGQVIGALHLRSRLPNAYRSDDIATAQAVADQVAGAVHYEILIAQMKRDAERRHILAEIGRIVSSTLRIEEIYPLFAEQAAKLVPFDRIVVALFDEAQQVSTNAYMAGQPMGGHLAGRTFPVAGGVLEQLVRSKKSFMMDGDETRRAAAANDSSSEALKAGLLSVLITPLIWQDRVIGSLNFRSKLHNPYTPAVVALAEQLAAEIAGAVTASTLYVQANKIAEERKVLAEIGRIVSSTLQIEDIYPLFAEQAAKLVPFDRIVIALFDEGQQNVSLDAYIAGTPIPGYAPGGRFPVAGTFFEQLLQSKSSVVVNGDEMRRQAATHTSALPALSAGLQSMLMTPLIWQDRVIGSLNFRSKLHDPYTPAVVALSEQVSAQIAGAITTSRLYGQAKRDALARATVAEFGRAVHVEMDTDLVCRAVSDTLGRLVKCDRCVISLPVPGAGKLRLAHVTGVHVDGVEVGSTVPFPPLKKKLGLEREDGSVLLGDLPPGPSGHLSPFLASGLRSWMEVPVGTAAGPLAYLSLRSREKDAYSEQDLELLKAIALQAAPAFRNATLLEDLEKRVAERTSDLSASDAAKTRMLATVSHELHNALAAVMGFNQFLLKDQTRNLTEQQVRVLRSIEFSTGQIASLARDLTDFSAIEAGRFKLEKKNADLAGIIKEVAAALAPAFTKKQQKIVVSGCDRPVEFEMDPDRVSQVLANLVSNASKYSPAGSPVTVSLEVSGGIARTAVRDQGIGISEEDRKQLFQSFFRANHPEVRAVSGTGLGLAVSRRLVELHKGGIDVESAPGRGSVFTVWLPMDAMAGDAGVGADQVKG